MVEKIAGCTYNLSHIGKWALCASSLIGNWYWVGCFKTVLDLTLLCLVSFLFSFFGNTENLFGEWYLKLVLGDFFFWGKEPIFEKGAVNHDTFLWCQLPRHLSSPDYFALPFQAFLLPLICSPFPSILSLISPLLSSVHCFSSFLSPALVSVTARATSILSRLSSLFARGEHQRLQWCWADWFGFAWIPT